VHFAEQAFLSEPTNQLRATSHPAIPNSTSKNHEKTHSSIEKPEKLQLISKSKKFLSSCSKRILSSVSRYQDMLMHSPKP
jgi:hypothetical protein